jgi:hypothetical protein
LGVFLSVCGPNEVQKIGSAGRIRHQEQSCSVYCNNYLKNLDIHACKNYKKQQKSLLQKYCKKVYEIIESCFEKLVEGRIEPQVGHVFEVPGQTRILQHDTAGSAQCDPFGPSHAKYHTVKL